MVGTSTCLNFSVCLSVRFVCALTCAGDLFPRLATFCVMVCLYYHLFISSSVDGHLDCFWFEALVNKTAVNLRVNTVFVDIYIFISLRYASVIYEGTLEDTGMFTFESAKESS